MSSPGKDVGFIPVGMPGAQGSGSTRTSTLLIEELSKHHNLHVFVISDRDVSAGQLPATDRVTYHIKRYGGSFPHAHYNRRRALRTVTEEFESLDLVHSYSSSFIPELAEVSVPTVVTLNSFLPVCPKDSLLYHDGRYCTGPAAGKCVGCILRSQDYLQRTGSAIKHLYFQFGSLGLVRDSLSAVDGIDSYHSLAPHLTEIYADLGFDPRSITTIPHFFDDRFLGEISELSSPVKILYAGKLTKKKGVNILPRALSGVGIDFELTLAGRGSQLEELKRAFSEEGISDSVTFLGFVDYENMPELYQEADIFLYPGQWAEPFGRVFLEALAAKTPVISSNVGSAEHIIGDAGEVYPHRELESKIAGGIHSITSRYEKYTGACEIQLEKFSKSRVIGKVNKLYDETLMNWTSG